MPWLAFILGCVLGMIIGLVIAGLLGARKQSDLCADCLLTSRLVSQSQQRSGTPCSLIVDESKIRRDK